MTSITKTEVTQAQQVIDMLPEQAKRDVLFSMVGSLNASLVGTASSIASRLEREGYELKELSVRDVEQLLSDPDSTDATLTEARKLVRVATGLRDQLIAAGNDSNLGYIYDTLEFMTKPSKRGLDAELLEATLAAANIKNVNLKHFAQLHAMNAAQRAARLASQRGMIEWLLEHVMSVSHSVDGDRYDREEVTETIEDLGIDARARLYGKLVTATNRARDNAVLGVLNRDRRHSLGDLMFVAEAITAAEHLEHSTELEVA